MWKGMQGRAQVKDLEGDTLLCGKGERWSEDMNISGG